VDEKYPELLPICWCSSAVSEGAEIRSPWSFKTLSVVGCRVVLRLVELVRDKMSLDPTPGEKKLIRKSVLIYVLLGARI
jgi:hypothetical protein